ncbi:uncharacterized protein LOC133175888 [Saccostrea echinata]|uniref:uncharacterized protein LOC133175888 n=1 Tax=Saccostrea echinata TaxID=191078 RepID=UPI002A83BE83|nr:uncharacterized protein LOC133175888 [Saccostrea echinata]
MWLRALLLISVTSSLVNSHGIYRAVNPRLIPWWFARFPNSRVLLNRDLFNHVYRKLILRDPYWHRRIHAHRHRIFHPIHLHRHVHRVQVPPLLSHRVIRKIPAPPVVKTASVESDKHLIGKAETFVRYSSPSIPRYNTPWVKHSSSYQDYGHVGSPSIYDRQVAGGVSGIYDEEVSLPVLSSAAGSIDSSVAPIPDYPVAQAPLDSSSVAPIPDYPFAQAPLPQLSSSTTGADKHLIGKSETFVRYYSPTIDRFNTPWKKVASSYRDYGHVNIPPVYDRQVLGAGPGIYDDELSLNTLPYGAGGLGSFSYGPNDGGFVAGGGIDGGFVAGGGVDGGFVAGGGVDGGFVTGGGVDGGFYAGGGSVDGGYSAYSGGGLSTYGANYGPGAQTTLRRDVF